MTILESNICTIAEWMKSNEIEALISELQMIADRKYSEEEEVKIYEEAWSAFVDNYLNNMKIWKQSDIPKLEGFVILLGH